MMYDDMPDDLGPAPGPDLEHVLDETFGDDEDAKAAARADITAMADHHAVHATAAHETIATLVWRTMRTLGIRGGHMLVVGRDPEVFAGVPTAERRLPPGEAGGFVAQIPQSAMHSGAPHPGLTLRQVDDTAPEEFDVVVHAPPHVDVTLHQPGAARARHVAQLLSVLGFLERTAPGGYFVTLASREIMDAPGTGVRDLIADRGELVGALRLPSGALRPGLPGNDAAVDLLVLRRSLVPGSDIPRLFIPTHEHRLGATAIQLNQYWLANPLHVLGEMEARPSPWGLPSLTVHAAPGYGLFTSLALGLEDIADHAHAVGLTAETGATIDARIRDARRDDPDAPIHSPRAHRHNLDDVRRQITALRAKRHAAEPPESDGSPRAPRDPQRRSGLGEAPPPRPDADGPGPGL